ncbi:MAG: XrtA system polysaccharide deacetylase [Pseudomonadota bacterium]|nr:XrtA system polysaccharide deacetylase [Pseudomonadota bacterium]
MAQPHYNAMTVDVEDYFHVSALAEVIRREDWDRMEYRCEQSTNRLLDLFAAHGLRATFFVLGWVAKRSPELVKRIHAAGHEVACHGLTHELVYRQTPEVFRQETRESKQLLEDLIGAPVLGYRAASYSITARSLWAIDILCELGFRYDSSIFPIAHDRYGIPGASTRPGLMQGKGGASIVEFPLSTAELFGRRVPVAGGGYFRLLPYWFTRWGLRSINESQDQPFIFYLHPWEIDADQPRFDASALSRFRHYTNLDVCEARLTRLIREFKFTTVKDVLRSHLEATQVGGLATASV